MTSRGSFQPKLLYDSKKKDKKEKAPEDGGQFAWRSNLKESIIVHSERHGKNKEVAGNSFSVLLSGSTFWTKFWRQWENNV